MPANGRYNRQAHHQSRPLLALTQVAPKKSAIAPLIYRRRRSSETVSATPNTRAGASRPRPSEPNFNFQLLPFADVDFIDVRPIGCGSECVWIQMCFVRVESLNR